MIIPSGSYQRGTVALAIFILFILAAMHVYFSPNGDRIASFFNSSTEEVTDTVTPDKKEPVVFELHCSTTSEAETCPDGYPKQPSFLQNETTTCPDYFQWIHEDLKPWGTGITREMLEKAKPTSHFRLVILKGKIYVEYYKKSFQTRDVFTIWGFVQLVRMYPGMVPDVELMFNCGDRPVNPVAAPGNNENGVRPPPSFGYCSDEQSLDIPFPDWSFWGWPETNIKPWNNLAGDISRGNQMINYVDREPYAFWKGNPTVAATRMDLLTCNLTEKNDWKARLFNQDWGAESHKRFKSSGLASQCNYRFKIYIEGNAWSVSQKYILACNSPTLVVKPVFHEFFSRGLEPLKHYWPIRSERKCKSIKYAVEWGNNHTKESEKMGKAASDFILNDVSMKYVYDYMYHLLHRYEKLMRFNSKIPAGAVEVCAETLACTTTGMSREFMAESLVNRPATSSPCIVPEHHPLALSEFKKKKTKTIQMVQQLEESD